MALHVRMAPCLLDEPVQSALDCAVRSISGSPVLAAKRVERMRRQRLVPHQSVSVGLWVCGSVSVGQCRSVSVRVCLSLSVCWSASVCLGLSRSVSVWFVGCELVHQTLT